MKIARLVELVFMVVATGSAGTIYVANDDANTVGVSMPQREP
jgi:hypothetical protein